MEQTDSLRSAGMGAHRTLVVAGALLLVAAGCGEMEGTVGSGGTVPQLPPTTIEVSVTAPPPTPPPSGIVSGPILGVWVQDDAGPALTHQRRFEFRPDGSYQFVFTARPTGSVSEQILSAESGRYSVTGDRLALSPMPGAPSQLRWRVESDPYVGGARLSLTFPDGTLGVYYRPN